MNYRGLPAWIFRPPRPPRGSFRRPLRPRDVRILDVCPIRLRSKRPCVLDGDENLSLGRGPQAIKSCSQLSRLLPLDTISRTYGSREPKNPGYGVHTPECPSRFAAAGFFAPPRKDF